MTGNPLTDRIVLAVVEALTDDDPVITIEVGDNLIRITYE